MDLQFEKGCSVTGNPQKSESSAVLFGGLRKKKLKWVVSRIIGLSPYIIFYSLHFLICSSCNFERYITFETSLCN